MTYHLSNLDGQVNRQSYLIDPRYGGSSITLSRVAAKQAELNRALAERRHQRRAAKARATRARRPIARTA